MQSSNRGRMVINSMSLETSEMSDSDYYRAADFVKNKTALQMRKVYKQCKETSPQKRSMWGRIKSYFGKG